MKNKTFIYKSYHVLTIKHVVYKQNVLKYHINKCQENPVFTKQTIATMTSETKMKNKLTIS